MSTSTRTPRTQQIQRVVERLGLRATPWLRRRPGPTQIPSTELLMVLILQLLADKSTRSLSEITNSIATACDFTEEQLVTLLPDGVRALLNQRIMQSLDALHEHGLAYAAGPGHYRITRLGAIVAETKPTVIDLKYLRRFPDYLQDEYYKKYGYFPKEGDPPPPPTLLPPEPALPGRRMAFLGESPPVDENLLTDPKNVVVWFDTNRLPNDPANAGMGFSNKRGDVEYFGRCIVNIPEGHKTASTKPGVFEEWTQGTTGVVVRSIEGMPEMEFWTQIGETLKSSLDGDSVLLFVHGYRVSFLEAAVRTAQLKYDLKIPHAAFYSWPSTAGLTGYGADVASVEGAVPYMAAFLRRLGELTADRRMKLHIIAHSMGNLGLLLALERILADLKGAPPRFGLADIVFAAPDVDRQKFTDYATRTTALFQQRTLYASHRDIPLGISGWLRRATRAGRIPPVTLVNGTDTIDVSDIDLSRLGHGYVAETRAVLTDIAAMFLGLPPVKRVGVNRSADGKYWVMT